MVVGDGYGMGWDGIDWSKLDGSIDWLDWVWIGLEENRLWQG